MSLDQIVRVNITTETASVTQAGFGTPLVLGDEHAWPERVRVYTSAAAMLEDGFTAEDASYQVVAAILSQNPKVPRVKVAMRSADEGVTLTQDLAAIQAIDDDWYGLILADSTTAEDLEAAAYIETTRKIFGISTSDEDVLDPVANDIAEQIRAAGYARTFVFYGAEDEHPAAALMGRCFPLDPGSETWMFKSLRGITPSKLTSTQQAALKAKNCNFYIELGGVPVTMGGVVGAGEYIDIVRGIDWLQARMQERIFGLLARADKVPFTDPGIALIENQVRAQLAAAVDVGLLADDPAPSVSVPRAQDVPQNDRADRHLPDVRFAGTLQGAIHSLEIQGTVSV